MNSWQAALTLTLIIPAFAIADQQPAPTSEVQRLVDLLGSPAYREREAAQKQLVTMGGRAILPLKEALKNSSNTEVQRRLEVLVEKLEFERLVAPSRVTIKVNNAPVDQVIKDVCKQAGYTTSESLPKDRFVSVDLKEVPFWEALQKISNLSGIYISMQEDEATQIYAYQNESISPFTTTAGPFLFVASNINSSKNLQLGNIPLRGGGNRQQEYLGMSIQVLAEPKCPILNVQQAIVTKAVDDKGVSLVPPGTNENILVESRYYNGYMYRSYNQSFGLSLQRGDRNATTIKELKGKVAMTLLKEIRPEITVDKVIESAKKKYVGETLDMEINDVSEAGGSLTIGLTFRQKNPNPNDYNWYNSIYQRLAVYDQDGKKLTSNGIQEQKVGSGIATMKMTFAPRDATKKSTPTKLVLNEWITMTQTFEFELKDIPLP